MPGLYSHTTRATGTLLTATIYNADHQNHIDNATPQQHDDYSANTAQMQTSTDPGEIGTESLPTSLAGEFERLRFALRELKGTTQWYETPSVILSGLSGQPTYRSLSINGDMFLNQAVQGAATTTSTFFVDGWRTENTATARLTTQQSTTNSPPGHVFNLLSTVTTSGSPAAGDVHLHGHSIEGVFVRFMGWGAASPIALAVSFQVRSSVTGTYALSVRNSAANRSYVAPIVINSANTWERKTFVIPGDTSGTWLVGPGQVGISVAVVMAIGSTYQTASNNTWLAGNFAGLTGMTQLTATGSATFQLAEFQAEPAAVSTFERLPFDAALERAMRYWQTSYPYGAAAGSTGSLFDTARGYTVTNNDMIALTRFPVEMCGTPTVVLYNPFTGTASNVRRTSNGTGYALSAGMSSGTRSMWACQGGGLFAVNELYDFHFTASARL